MEFLLYFVLLFVTILGLILFMPLRFGAVLSGGERRFSLSWSFLKYSYSRRQRRGTVRIGPLPITLRGKRKITEKKERPKLPEKPKRKGIPISALLNYRGTLVKLLRESVVALFRILCSLNLRQADLEIRFGGEDPATTGMLYGLCRAVRGGLLPSTLRLEVIPDFEEETFQGSVEIEIQLWLYRLLWIILLFVWAIPKLQTFKLVRDLKQRRGANGQPC
jgi:hypothetical protein